MEEAIFRLKIGTKIVHTVAKTCLAFSEPECHLKSSDDCRDAGCSLAAVVAWQANAIVYRRCRTAVESGC